uniref:Uncharacterized protein n=1 Tax=Anguilla anguilla TaxID=7936 RepID=A0A0E9P995_ANGAN
MYSTKHLCTHSRPKIPSVRTQRQGVQQWGPNELNLNCTMQ